MAFLVQAIRQGTTYNLYGRTSYALIRVRGIGSPDLRNITRVAPQQHGETFLDYRLQSRNLVLELELLAASDSALDATRRQIVNIFHPAQTTQLKFTTDDSSVRYLDVRLAGPMVDYAVGPEERHTGAQLLVRVPVVAYSPAFYADSFTRWNTTTRAGAFQDAYQGIPDNDIEQYDTTPAIGATWSSASNIGYGKPWTVAVRTGVATNGRCCWQINAVPGTKCMKESGNITFLFDNIVTINTGVAWSGGTSNYAFVCDGKQIFIYIDNVKQSETVPWTEPFSAASGRWRTDGTNDWDVGLTYAAVYNKALNDVQVKLLSNAMSGGSNIRASKRVTYTGSWKSQPIVYVLGSGASTVDPIIYNGPTGEKLDFTGVTVASAELRVVNTATKQVFDHTGANKIPELVDGSNLDTFHLASSTEITDGQNGLVLWATSGGTEYIGVIYDTFYLGL